ncbi:2TM domain-containing protein [Sandaracinus amylolyticus]|uniref:2TM domain-containing protein n=1 Tax=Sandaracinus amylolyticus TaxID=927083 RepID=A0A0F6W150_9BACT|nr:2TM domain-containing protein [Sandaracinus amylolyticus]AKF04780.1 hypothetical protein DB32_001929 [Sandaracinus amylolyticus]
MADERETPRYTREEVEEILRRAAERTHDRGDALRHDELVAAAREAGIDVSAVESAAGELAERREDRLAVESWKAARRRRFASHFLTWLVVNAGLFLLDLLGGPGWWFFYPLLGWGIAVALQGVGALREPTPAQVERVTRKDRRRREAERKREARRLEREARRHRDRGDRDRRKRIEKEFERAVESGVSALLQAATKHLDKATRRDEGPLPDTEFNRYVARKKGGPTGARVGDVGDGDGRGPRVRVDHDEDFDDEDERERRGSSRKLRR